MYRYGLTTSINLLFVQAQCARRRAVSPSCARPGMATESAVVNLADINWPLPPPSPPHLPPLPPPERHLNSTADQLECVFEQGIDLSVSSNEGDAAVTMSAAHAVDTQAQCCALCAMKSSCMRFVFIPGSGACALLPRVPKAQLLRISNPATVAGTVFVAHADRNAPAREHARCEFKVGYGYAQGALGAGRPLDEPTITTQQECCDACERNLECAKFVFEKYGGGCQLFASIAEIYHTPGLIAGELTARMTLDYLAGGGDIAQPHEPPMPPFLAPPAPPTLKAMRLAPPPATPLEGETAQVVLAYVSMVVIGVMISGVLMCAYCFYFGEIQGLLHRWTNGRIGQPHFALLPKSLQRDTACVDPEEPPEAKRRGGKKQQRLLAHKAIPSDHTPVTCVTQHVQQRKHVPRARLAECETLDELQILVWDEFGHLLKDLRARDTCLLCWTSPEHEEGDANSKASEWSMITSVSSMPQVVACTALKLADKQLVTDTERNRVAFAKSLTMKSSPPGRRRRGPTTVRAVTEEPQLSKVVDSADTAPPGKSSNDVANSTGGEQSDGGSVLEDLHAQISSPISRQGLAAGLAGTDASVSEDISSRDLGRRRGAGVVYEPSDDEHSTHEETAMEEATDSLHKARAWQEERKLAQNVASIGQELEVNDSIPLCEQMQPSEAAAMPCRTPTSNDLDANDNIEGLLHHRVQIVGLQSKGALNGRFGLVSGFDPAKNRWRVRLEGDGQQLLAFKVNNLRSLGENT